MIFGNWRPVGLLLGLGAVRLHRGAAAPRGRRLGARAAARWSRSCSSCRALPAAARGDGRRPSSTLGLRRCCFLVWLPHHRRRPERLHPHDAVRHHAAGARASPRNDYACPRPTARSIARARRVDRPHDDFDWDGLTAAGGRGGDARLRAVLPLPGRRRRRWSTTAGSSPAATSRTRRTAWRCAPSAGMVSQLHITGGGRLTHFVCVNGQAEVIMPCGRCRQLLLGERRPGAAAADRLRRDADERGAAGCLRSRRPRLT